MRVRTAASDVRQGVPRVPERLGVSVVPEVWATRAAERLGDEVRNRLAQPAAMRAAESGVKGGSDFISHKNRKNYARIV